MLGQVVSQLRDAVSEVKEGWSSLDTRGKLLVAATVAVAFLFGVEAGRNFQDLVFLADLLKKRIAEKVKK